VFGHAEGARDVRHVGDSHYEVDLTEDELALLRTGISQWLGTARCSDAVAAVVGFADADDLRANVRRLLQALDAQAPLPASDWRRVLVSAEIIFGSDVLGCGVEWPTVTGLSDADSLTILRQLQRVLAALVRGRPANDRRIREVRTD